MDAGLVGRILLYAAIATSAWGAAASLLGKHRADARLAVSGRRGLYASTAIAVQAPRRPELVGVATAVLSGILAFFAVILAFGANAFVSSSPIPLDGQGLNPS